jgi:hypothetical protein
MGLLLLLTRLLGIGGVEFDVAEQPRPFEAGASV